MPVLFNKLTYLLFICKFKHKTTIEVPPPSLDLEDSYDQSLIDDLDMPEYIVHDEVGPKLHNLMQVQNEHIYFSFTHIK